MSIGTLAETQPDKPAAIRPSTGETRTFRDLNDRSNQLAQLLHAHGIGQGDHVAMVLENRLEFLDVAFACLRSGIYITPINWHLSAVEAAYIVDNCDARALIASAALETSEALGRLSPRCEVKLSVGGTVPGFEDFEAAIAGYEARPLAQQPMGGFMLYSSGTTGRPKGIKRPLAERTFEEGSPAMKSTTDMFDIDASSVYLSPAPLYHSSPAGYTAGVIRAGGTVVVMDRFDPEEFLALVEKYRVTHSQCVPTMFVRMLKLPPEVRARYDLSSHKCAIHAAAPCPVEVKRQMIEWWGPIIEEYYSSTELAGFSRVGSKDWLTHPGTVGRSQGLPFHICDEEGRELPAGQTGTIYGESPTAAAFTYHKDQANMTGALHPEHRPGPRWATWATWTRMVSFI